MTLRDAVAVLRHSDAMGRLSKRVGGGYNESTHDAVGRREEIWDVVSDAGGHRVSDAVDFDRPDHGLLPLAF